MHNLPTGLQLLTCKFGLDSFLCHRCDHGRTGQGEVKAAIKFGVPLAVVTPLAQQEKPRQERLGQDKRLEISILPGPQRGSAQTETDTRKQAAISFKLTD